MPRKRCIYCLLRYNFRAFFCLIGRIRINPRSCSNVLVQLAWSQPKGHEFENQEFDSFTPEILPNLNVCIMDNTDKTGIKQTNIPFQNLTIKLKKSKIHIPYIARYYIITMTNTAFKFVSIKNFTKLGIY